MISKKPLCDGADNIIKRIGIQTGHSHKSAIDVRFLKEAWKVLGSHTAAVNYPHGLGQLFPIFFNQLTPNVMMNLLSLGGRGAFPGTNGPYRFIGNDEGLQSPGLYILQPDSHLVQHHFMGFSTLSLGRSFTQTKDNFQTTLQGGSNLLADHNIGLSIKGPALGVPKNDPLAPGILEHGRRDFPRKGPLGLVRHILRGQKNGRPIQQFRGGTQCREGRRQHHIVGRHASRRKAAATPLAILIGVPAGIVSSIAPRLGKLAALPAAIAGSVAISAYSRQQEHAADEFGVDYAAAAGYEPGALADALRALEREHALHGDASTRSSFLSSHPSTPDRRQRVRQRALGLVPGPAAPVARGRAAVLERLSGLMAGPNPKNGSFAGDRFLHPGLEFSIRMPSDWEHVNTPEAVASMLSADRRDVFVTLQLAGAGDDPMDLFAESDLDEATRSRIERRRIAGLPAAQLTVEAEGSIIDFTWVSYGGRIYAITGVAPATEARRYAPVWKGVADSFAPLRATDRAKIKVLRVAIVEARSDESLTSLARRSGAAWSADWISAANAWALGDRLSQGQGVKIVVERRYESRP